MGNPTILYVYMQKALTNSDWFSAALQTNRKCGRKSIIDSGGGMSMIMSYLSHVRSISHEHAPENHHAD